MKKRLTYWICSVLMVLSLGLYLADRFYFFNLSAQTQSLTIWTFADVFLAQPIFYGALGVVATVKLFGAPKKEKTGKICLWCGIVLSLLLLTVGALHVFGALPQVMALGLILSLFKTPGFFLLPGVLLGLGLAEPAED